jgi:hypothetical protein
MLLTLLRSTSTSPSRLLAADSLGALLSALLLGTVLAHWSVIFGMPVRVLYTLATIALVMALCSGVCSLWAGKHWRSCLRIIAVINILYAVANIGLLLYFYAQVRVWGLLYFGGELLIIALLVRAEWHLSSHYSLIAKQ